MDDASDPATNYSAEFLAAVDRLLQDEGGLTVNPYDPGGITRYGISAREYPTLDIASLTRDDAIAIYHRDYWQRFDFDQLAGAAAGKTFNLAVDMGPGHAIKCLQRALRAVGHRVPEDGAIGPTTATAVRASDPSALIAALRSEAAGYYRVMAALARSARPDGDREFLTGWLNRAYQ